MSSICRVVRVIRCRWPAGRAGAPGRVTSTRSLASLASSSAASSSLGAPLEQLLERLARRFAAAADLAPFLRRQLGDAAQDRRQLGFAAQVADPQLLQLGGAGRGLDRRRGLAPDLLDPLKHLAAPPAWRATIAASTSASITTPLARTRCRLSPRPRRR